MSFARTRLAGTPEVGLDEVNPPERSPAEVGLLEVDFAEIGTAENSVAQVGVAELRYLLASHPPLVPFLDTIRSAKKQLEGFVSVHVGHLIQTPPTSQLDVPPTR